MAKRIKVLQLQSKYAAGVNHVADMITSALPNDQYDVTMAYLEGEVPHAHGQLHLFKFSKAQCRGFRREVKANLLAYCTEQQFDIVIGHRFKAISALMPVVRKLNIAKAVAVVHGIGDYDRWYRKLLAGYYFSSHWEVVAVSKYVESYLRHTDKIFDSCLVSVIPNAVDVEVLQTNFLTRSEARSQLGLAPTDFVFGAHGRLSQVKGYNYLLEAFALVARDNLSVKLLLMGDGPLRNRLAEQAESLGIGSQLILTGYNQWASRYLRAFNVFVMPSYSEGMSIALLEAMSASLPLLASDIPSIAAVITDESCLIEVGSIASWEIKMRHTLSVDSDDLSLLGRKSFKRVSEVYNKTVIQESYRKILL